MTTIPQSRAIVAPQAVKIEDVSLASTMRKAGVVTRVATRVAKSQAERSRTVNAALSAGRATLRSFGNVLHQLWLEVTGAVFLFIAAVGALAFAREYAKYETGHTTAGRVMLAVGFTLMFTWFGVSSFMKVRKKQ